MFLIKTVAGSYDLPGSISKIAGPCTSNTRVFWGTQVLQAMQCCLSLSAQLCLIEKLATAHALLVWARHVVTTSHMKRHDSASSLHHHPGVSPYDGRLNGGKEVIMQSSACLANLDTQTSKVPGGATDQQDQ